MPKIATLQADTPPQAGDQGVKCCTTQAARDTNRSTGRLINTGS